MTTKTFRTIYLSESLDSRILMRATQEGTSISKLVRSSLEKYLDASGGPCDNRENQEMVEAREI
jgi:hypothetical protein